MQESMTKQEVLLTKEEFVDIINRLRESSELVDKVNELFRKSRENIECDFCNGAGLQISHEGIVVNLLEKLMRDKYENISYFIYELNFGDEYQEGCIYDDNGNIDISTADKLYDYLMSYYQIEEKEGDENAEKDKEDFNTLHRLKSMLIRDMMLGLF